MSGADPETQARLGRLRLVLVGALAAVTAIAAGVTVRWALIVIAFIVGVAACWEASRGRR